MKSNLKTSVKNYVQSKQLDDQQFAALQELNLAHRQPVKSYAAKRRYAVIATVLLVLIAGSIWSIQPRNSKEISIAIAEEVAYNHIKIKPLEVTSRSLDDVRNYFSELDFTLIDSSVVAAEGLQLLGGRYCSIQGESAAQLRMLDKQTGDVQMVYQAPYNKELFASLPNIQEGQPPVRHYVNGVAVDVWVEKGILFSRSGSEL